LRSRSKGPKASSSDGNGGGVKVGKVKTKKDLATMTSLAAAASASSPGGAAAAASTSDPEALAATTTAAAATASDSGDDSPPVKRSRQNLRRKPIKNLPHKSVASQTSDGGREGGVGDFADDVKDQEEAAASSSRSRRRRRRTASSDDLTATTVMSLQPEVIHHICKFCDARTLLSLFRSCKWFYNMLKDSNSFWRLICVKEEMANYPCINEKSATTASQYSGLLDDEEPSEGDASTSAAAAAAAAAAESTPPFVNKTGYAGLPMRVDPDSETNVHWRKVFLRGLQMRRNISKANFEGWRIYANSDMPLTRLTPELDFNGVKQKMGNFPKLSMNDDLKIDWNEQYLVVFHFVRRDGETCTIRVWDIEGECPKYLFSVEKGVECITDKISVIKNSVVIVPSWPLAADALVMTLQIDEEKKAIHDLGKFRFPCDERMKVVDDNWEHTMLRAVRDMAVVVLKAPEWQCVVVDLPTCQLKYAVNFNDVPRDFDCQQIRSFKCSALILFSHKSQESANCLVTMHISGGGGGEGGKDSSSKIKLRNVYHCHNTVDAALFTEPEEIFLMKRNGDVVLYDADTNTETVRVRNPAETRDSPQNEYQLFVNRKEQICVMQSSSEVSTGRNINVYTYDQKLMYTLNLDLCKYGLSRDESICIYTNAAFLAAADSKKFVFFDVKNGRHIGELRIPAHLERSKAKDEKFCMFDQTGLSLFIFDEDKLIAVHDYERCFPAVLDIYKFW